MKNIKSISCVILLGLALIVQLLYPIPVHADGEITPLPTDTPEVISTPLPEDTTTSVATDTPTEVVPSETPTPDPSLITPTDSVLPETPAIDPSLMTPIASPSTDIPPTEVPTLLSATALSEATTDPVETDTPTLEPPTATVASATATPDSAAIAASPDGTASVQPTLLETLQQVSSDTSVVVLDANGQPVSLSTQEAADIIASSDPVWCPAGQAPTPGSNGCTISYGTLGALVAGEGGSISADGTIWITTGFVPDSSDIIIDGSTYTNWANNSLTLQGGWSGTSGDMSIGANSVFTVPISISNWNNSIAIDGIDAPALNISGTTISNGGNILLTYNNAPVNIKNVHIDHATGFGLGIDWHTGDIAIDDSSITNTVADDTGTSYFPWGDGADIFPNGSDITVTNSQFNNNAYDGIYTVGAGKITVKSTSNCSPFCSQFNGNAIGGLDTFLSNGITTTNTEFTNNTYYDLSAYCNYPVDPFYNYVTLLFPDVIPSATPTNPTYASFSVDSQCNFGNYQLRAGGTTSFAPPTKGNNPKISATIARYITLASKSRLEFNISCDNGQTSFTVPLPNGDKVEIVCPMHGKATISRLDSTILPDELPAGYTYASAFQLDISKSKVENGEFQTELIPVITEGGYIKASFVPTPLQPGRTFAVLFWDANTSQWIPLKDFAVGHSYKLVPGDSNDSRVIRSGVQLVSTGGARRVEVSTNFPGIFVLVQH